MQDIFIRCLRPSCSVALWKFYLDFVRRRNPIDHALPEQAKQARATITKSFEFALSHIGQAREAGEVWLEYIEFLKEGGVSVCARSSPSLSLSLPRCRSESGSREAWCKRTVKLEDHALTRVTLRMSSSYSPAEQRHLGRPAEDGQLAQDVSASRPNSTQQRRADLAGVQLVREQLVQDDCACSWRDTSCSTLRLTRLIFLFPQAKRFVSELSPAYMTARKVLRELRAQFDDLAQPDLPERPDWNDGARGALDQWRRYLAYEESNPLDIEEQPVLQQRVGFAYKKAVAYLRFFSEVWSVARGPDSFKFHCADDASCAQVSRCQLQPQARQCRRGSHLAAHWPRGQPHEVRRIWNSLAIVALTQRSLQSAPSVHFGRTRRGPRRIRGVLQDF